MLKNNSTWRSFVRLLSGVTMVAMLSANAGAAHAALLFTNDTTRNENADSFTINSDDDVDVSSFNFGGASNLGYVQFTESTGEYMFGEGLGSGLGGNINFGGNDVSLTGDFDASGSTQFITRLDDPSTALCHTVGEMIVSSVDNEVYICTAIGNPDPNTNPGTWQAAGSAASGNFLINATEAGTQTAVFGDGIEPDEIDFAANSVFDFNGATFTTDATNSVTFGTNGNDAGALDVTFQATNSETTTGTANMFFNVDDNIDFQSTSGAFTVSTDNGATDALNISSGDVTATVSSGAIDLITSLGNLSLDGTTGATTLSGSDVTIAGTTSTTLSGPGGSELNITYADTNFTGSSGTDLTFNLTAENTGVGNAFLNVDGGSWSVSAAGVASFADVEFTNVADSTNAAGVGNGDGVTGILDAIGTNDNGSLIVGFNTTGSTYLDAETNAYDAFIALDAAVATAAGGDFLAANADDTYGSAAGVQTLTIGSGLEADAVTFAASSVFDASGAGQFRMRSDSAPNTNSACNVLGELIYNTTFNTIMSCTATGTPGTWEALNAADADQVDGVDANQFVRSDEGDTFGVNGGTELTDTYVFGDGTNADELQLAANAIFNTGTGAFQINSVAVTANATELNLLDGVTSLFTAADIDTESELESVLTDVTNVLTNNDTTFDVVDNTAAAFTIGNAGTGPAMITLDTTDGLEIVDVVDLSIGGTALSSTTTGDSGADLVGISDDGGYFGLATNVEDALQVVGASLDAIEGPNSLYLTAELANSVIDTANAGRVTFSSDRDNTLGDEHNYYHAETTQTTDQTIDLDFEFNAPHNLQSTGNSNLVFEFRTATDLVADNSVTVTVDNQTDGTACGSNTQANSTGNAGTWESASVDTSSCTVDPGDVIHVNVSFTVNDSNSGTADISAFQYNYNALPPA